MNSLRGAALFIVMSFVLVIDPVTARAQGSTADAEALQKKATEAQARIQANKDARDQLMIAIKTNEVPLAKQVLLRNGFTAEDLENTKITLRTGGGKKSEGEFEISATCCDPKEITIQRSLDYFTK
jgi:type II secretory pathway component PulM